MGYAGGKNAPGVYQTIINQIPPHRVYIEPFAGSAAIYRYKRLAHLSYLIDKDPAAVAAIQAMVDVDYRRIGLSSSGGGGADRGSANQFVDANTGIRIPQAAPPMVAGAARQNRRRPLEANPPALDRLQVNPPASADASAIGICADATRFLKQFEWRGDEFVYADPPYLNLARRSKRQIYQHEIQTEEDHIGILNVLAALPCAVMISGYWSQLYGERLAAWRVVRFQAMTRGGVQVCECLWMNYPEPIELHDYSYLGKDARQRQDIKRMKERWIRRLEKMPTVKRQAILAALQQLTSPIK